MGDSVLPAEILKINPDTPDARLVSYVADRIKQGQVVGMPTDTFYGLAADPLNLRAVDLIYDVKTRSRHKPLSLLIESVEQAEYLARPLPDVFYEITRKYWPGPLTIIVKASSRLPLKVTANTGNVALRVPASRICGGSNPRGRRAHYSHFRQHQRGQRVHHRGRSAATAGHPHQHDRGRRPQPARRGFHDYQYERSRAHHRPAARRNS